MTDSHDSFFAFEEALRIAGSQTALARIAGVTQGAIWLRLNGKKPIAAEWARKIEAATGVSRYRLRPDVFGPDPTEAAQITSLNLDGA